MDSSADVADSIGCIQLTRSNLFDQIAEQIQQIIVKGGLQEGQRLPPERELTQRLGASRPVTREATKVLQERGLVSIRPGSGTYVTQPASHTVTRPLSLYLRSEPTAMRDILEIRHLLEVQLVGLAVTRADEGDLEELELATDEMEEALRSLKEAGNPTDRSRAAQEFAAANVSFHISLVRASGNRLAGLVLEPIMQLLLEAGWSLAMQTGGSETAPLLHRQIIAGIRDQDIAGCREAIREDIGVSAAAWARLENDSSLLHIALP